MLCAKVRSSTTADQAEVLLEHMKALIMCWKMNWTSERTDDPGRDRVVQMKLAAKGAVEQLFKPYRPLSA